METLNISTFRNDLAASFDRAANGEKVLIRRGRQVYALMCVGAEDITITPALQKRIDAARKSYHNGNSRILKNKQEINDYFDSL